MSQAHPHTSELTPAEVSKLSKRSHRSPVHEFWMLWIGPGPIIAIGLLYLAPSGFLGSFGIFSNHLIVWLGISYLATFVFAALWLFLSIKRVAAAKRILENLENLARERQALEKKSRIEEMLQNNSRAQGSADEVGG